MTTRVVMKLEQDMRRATMDLAFARRVDRLGGVVDVSKEPVDAETGTLVTGVFDVGRGRELRVVRACAYLRATLRDGLMGGLRSDGVESPGYRLNHTPFMPQKRTSYSGRTDVLGSVCRAQGFAGGLEGQAFLDYMAATGGLREWNIDDESALGPFVETLRKVLKEG
jgi:hypothetical protein